MVVMLRKRGILILYIVVGVLSFLPLAAAEDQPSIAGYVFDGDGIPLEGANVAISRWRLYDEVVTDLNGYYEFDHKYSYVDIYVYYDFPETEGLDYMPQRSRRVYADSGIHNFTLFSGATVFLEGQLKIVESNVDISSYVFKVEYDPTVYDTATRVYEKFLYQGQSILDMDPSTVFAPAGVPFNITVSPEMRKSSYMNPQSSTPAFKEFTISSGSGFILQQGALLTIDIQKYSLVNDFETVKTIIAQAELAKVEAESQGYYTSAEGSMISDAMGLLQEAEGEYLQGEYSQCYSTLRGSYLVALNVLNTLNSLTLEAAVSVNVILVFMAFSASALASLVSESRRTRVAITIILYALMVAYLNVVFPGCKQVDVATQLIVAAISILGALLLPVIRIDALNKLKIGEVGFYDTVNSVFSMAKRNLKRRKLRTGLTTSTLLTLTMGFVALTSMSSSYGLVFASIGDSPIGSYGVTVRMPEFDIVSNYVDPSSMDVWRPVDAGYFKTLDTEILTWLKLDPRVQSLDVKLESLPGSNTYTPRSPANIYGIVGLMPGSSMDLIGQCLVSGNLPHDPLTCIVHVSLIEDGIVQLGGSLELRQRTVGPSRTSRMYSMSEPPVYLTVVGAFDDGVKSIKDMDGSKILPYKQSVSVRGKGPFIYTLSPEVCSPSEVVFTGLEGASMFNDVGYSRVNLNTVKAVDLELLGKNLAMSRDIRVWINDGVSIQIAYLGETLGGKGLSLGIPWGIVLLNVVITMLNTMQERKKEIDILSSIGLNPAHISGVFISEAVVMGLIAGGFGYILGIGVYPLMGFFSSQPSVEMKVSAVWCIGSVGLSLISVLAGSLISLRNSAALTPSHDIKYLIDEESKNEAGVWTLPLPMKVEAPQVMAFLNFTRSYLNEQKNSGKMPYVGLVIQDETESPHGISYSLKFSFSQTGDHVDRKYTLNRLLIEPDQNQLYTAKLLSQGEHEGTQYSINYTRMMFLKWSTQVDGDLPGPSPTI
jgi:hypothetical protein